jgi:hypothetical protein
LIYFIHSLDDPCGLVKIGYTDRPVENRIAALQVGSPVRLSLLLAIEGTLRTEQLIHHRLRASRVFGEWFAPTPAVVKFIRALAEPILPTLAAEILAAPSRLRNCASALGLSVADAERLIRPLAT